jgi:hypothetical protein
MLVTRSLRHFDRGSGEPLTENLLKEGWVFGGTGACLLLRRSFIERAILSAKRDSDAWSIYPQLAMQPDQRKQLFDEAFFAYREDADLAWRGQILGWRCLYVPSAVVYHKRVVVPERRAKLPAFLNACSVRNRFLLQLNNWTFTNYSQTVIPGIIMRNLLVIGGVILRERESLSALRQAVKLIRRGWNRRRELQSRASLSVAGNWFRDAAAIQLISDS